VQRSHEIAVRIAIGATSWRITRQLLVECLLIALLGGALGFAFSLYGVQEIAVAFDVIEPGAPRGTTRPYWIDVTPNAIVYGFVGLLSIGSALVFGLLPAWQTSKNDVNETLKEDGRVSGTGPRARRWSSSLVTAELALTLVLLAGAGLLWRGFLDRYRQDTVIDTAGVVTMRLALPVQKYRTPDDRKRFLEQLDDRLSALTVFSSVTMASHVPMEFGAPARELFIDGVTPTPGQPPPLISYMLTGKRYFDALSVPIVRGRAIGPADARPGQEGAVIDERCASQFFPNADPIGRRIRLGTTGVWFTIVGIARTLPQSGPAPAIRPVVYAALHAEPAPEGRAAIIAKGPIAAVSATLREEVRGMDPTLPLFAIETLDAALARGRLPARVISTWFGVLAIVALILAAVGVFAISAHNVAQRTHEIAVRIAVGADPASVVRLFLRRTAIQLGVATALGLAGTIAVGRLVRSILSDAAAPDPATFIVVTMVLAAVAWLSTLVPARRAAQVDPATTLRRAVARS
jgi:putative ABC transport system permease protein